MQHSPLKLVIIISLLAPLGVGASTLSASATAKQNAQKFLGQAQQSFQSGNYKTAEIQLRQAVSEDSTNVSAHYYLANTLVHLQRHDEAVEEFRRCYRLDPFGPASGYCRKALLTYGQPILEDSGALAASEGSGELDATEARQRFEHKAAVKEKPVAKKIAAIQSQAEREKQRHQEFADSLAKSSNLAAETEAQQIRNRAKDELDSIMNGARSPYPSERALDAERAKVVQSNAEEMERITRDRALKRSMQYSEWSKNKGKLLDEAVSNIEHQLNGKSLPGTPKLKEDGTDLFVRNYEVNSSNPKALDPHPAIVRVRETVEEKPVVKEMDALKGAPKNLPNPQISATKTVHGQLMPPL